MRYSALIAALLALGLTGCGQKQESMNPPSQGPETTAPSSPTNTPPASSEASPGTGGSQSAPMSAAPAGSEQPAGSNGGAQGQSTTQ